MNNKQLVTKQHAEEIAAATSDAYSFSRYGATSWKASCVMLARRGYNSAEIEAIMRSKWTRWAGDMSNHDYGRVNSKDLERFLDDPRNECTAQRVKQLAAGTL